MVFHIAILSMSVQCVNSYLMVLKDRVHVQGDPEYVIPLRPLIILFQQHMNYSNLYQNNLQRFKFSQV